MLPKKSSDRQWGLQVVLPVVDQRLQLFQRSECSPSVFFLFETVSGGLWPVTSLDMSRIAQLTPQTSFKGNTNSELPHSIAQLKTWLSDSVARVIVLDKEWVSISEFATRSRLSNPLKVQFYRFRGKGFRKWVQTSIKHVVSVHPNRSGQLEKSIFEKSDYLYSA